MKQPTFPKNFLWGASTAAHQVEGNNHNQWSEWEKANAEKLARTAEQRLGWLPNWATVKAQAEAPENYVSGRGIEHYERYKEDFKLLKQLNMNAFRFSIEWSRIEPEEGKWDEREVEHYRRYLQELKRQGIEPIVTLWHWTMPTWFVDKGAFEKRSNIRYFERFVAKVADELGAEFRYVAILNEPSSYVYMGYVTSDWPPQRPNKVLALRVYANLAAAHKRCYRVIKAVRPELQVGIAHIMLVGLPVNPRNPINRVMVAFYVYCSNWWFLNRIQHALDFIGVNYYFTAYGDSLARQRNPKNPVNDLGWYMKPENIDMLLKQTWQRYHKPIIVTENGLADAQDKQRKWWLEQTVSALERALAAGVDLRGYLHWSLLDNFEWAFGWWPKFGLIEVDRKTMKRTIRPSAKWLAEYVRRHAETA